MSLKATVCPHRGVWGRSQGPQPLRDCFARLHNALALNPSGGNVGVGTTAPGAPLHVNGISLFGASTSRISLGGGMPVGEKGLWMMFDGTNNYGQIQSERQGVGYSPLILNANGGNVGIGTTAPATALQVNGAVTSLQYTITVNTTGSIVVIANTAANILFASYGNGVWLVTAHATSMTNPQGGSTVSATAYVAINANTPTFANVFGGANSQAAAMTIVSNGYGVSLSIGNTAGYGTYRVNFLQIN